MSRLSLAFFGTGGLMVMVGMVWGSMMGASGDHSLAPAHAHLNLVGWASLGLMGAFYGIAGDRAPRRLGWINYALSSLGVVVMVPSLAVLLGGDESVLPFMMVAEVLVMAGMVSFLLVILLTARNRASNSASVKI